MGGYFCLSTEGALAGGEDRATSVQNRYDSRDVKQFCCVSAQVGESAMERAWLPRTLFLFQRDDAPPGCRRDRWCEQRSCDHSDRIVPDIQEWRQCFDQPA